MGDDPRVVKRDNGKNHAYIYIYIYIHVDAKNMGLYGLIWGFPLHDLNAFIFPCLITGE